MTSPERTHLPRRLDERILLLSVLGRGAMGVVYRARDEALRRDVAVKFCLAADNERAWTRFQREGKILAALDHPGILKVHSAGVANGQAYFVTELVEDVRTLDELTGADLRTRIGFLRDAARALGYAHAQGVVHRDVKPANILIDGADGVRVADFGVATATDLDRITQTGALVGTPAYMAPEQLRGDRPAYGPATDVWALGATLYETLSGTLPFAGTSLIELIAQVLECKPKRLAGVPADLRAICEKALQLDPSNRFVDGEAFALALDRHLSAPDSPPTKQRGRGRRLALAVGAVLCVAALARVGWGPSAPDSAKPDTLGEVPLPNLEISSPRPNDVVVDPSVEIKGTISHTKLAKLRVLVNDSQRGARLDLGNGSFSQVVSLKSGENVIRVRVKAKDGREGPTSELRIQYVNAPNWYRDLTDSKPPLPLPDGMRFGGGVGEYVSLKDKSVLVWVKRGTFTMGPAQTPGRAGTLLRHPAHQVTLTRDYFMGKYEVTWKQFRVFCAKTGRRAPTISAQDKIEPDHPVQAVTYFDSRDYVIWADLRLPTEAEWEYAATGGDDRKYPWGDEDEWNGRANCLDAGLNAPVAVTTLPGGKSPFGCYQMIGNVCEWVSGSFGVYPSTPQTDPHGSRNPISAHTIRGSGFSAPLSFCEARFRSPVAGLSRGGVGRVERPDFGFRVARSAN
jgi:serine/threonine protein kinase